MPSRSSAGSGSCSCALVVRADRARRRTSSAARNSGSARVERVGERLSAGHAGRRRRQPSKRSVSSRSAASPPCADVGDDGAHRPARRRRSSASSEAASADARSAHAAEVESGEHGGVIVTVAFRCRESVPICPADVTRLPRWPQSDLAELSSLRAQLDDLTHARRRGRRPLPRHRRLRGHQRARPGRAVAARGARRARSTRAAGDRSADDLRRAAALRRRGSADGQMSTSTQPPQFGLAREAHLPAVQDQAQREPAALLGRDERVEVELRLHRVGLGGELQPARQPPDVRVDRAGRGGRTPPTARRCRSCARRPGSFTRSSSSVGTSPSNSSSSVRAMPSDVLRLRPEEPGGVDDPLDVVRDRRARGRAASGTWRTARA